MITASRTWSLAGALVALLAADVFVHTRSPEEAPLPSLGAFSPSDVTSVTITRGDTQLRLEPDGDDWRIVQPFEHDADDALVLDLLSGLGRGIRMDARVDDAIDSHDKYGLSSDNPIRVEVQGVGDVLSDMYVGANAAGGSSFVRLPGSEVVYRARIGGRSRFERAPPSWRDLAIVDLEAARIIGLDVSSAMGRLSFSRPLGLGDEGPGPWALEQHPSLALDDSTITRVVQAIASLRALEIVPGDHPAMADPMAVASLELDGGESYRLVFGRVGDQRYAQLDGEPTVYRIAPQIPQILAGPVHTWRDRHLWNLAPQDVVGMELHQGERHFVLSRDPVAGHWVLADSAPGWDAELAGRAAAYLASMEVMSFVAVTPESAGFPSEERMVIRTASAGVTLEIGARITGLGQGYEAWYVRDASAPERIGSADARVISALRKAWDR